MGCLLAVSSWFVQRASLTVNIDLSDVINRYSQYCTVRSWYMRKRIDHWCSVVPEKIPTLGSTVQWETRQASFPTGTVGPRVGIYLSPLNTNNGFYLSRISYAYLTWVAMWDRFFRQRAYMGITRSRMRWYVRKDFLSQGKISDILFSHTNVYEIEWSQYKWRFAGWLMVARLK